MVINQQSSYIQSIIYRINACVPVQKLYKFSNMFLVLSIMSLRFRCTFYVLCIIRCIMCNNKKITLATHNVQQTI